MQKLQKEKEKIAEQNVEFFVRGYNSVPPMKNKGFFFEFLFEFNFLFRGVYCLSKIQKKKKTNKSKYANLRKRKSNFFFCDK